MKVGKVEIVGRAAEIEWRALATLSKELKKEERPQSEPSPDSVQAKCPAKVRDFFSSPVIIYPPIAIRVRTRNVYAAPGGSPPWKPRPFGPNVGA
jgi:hypothetical protein